MKNVYWKFYTKVFLFQDYHIRFGKPGAGAPLRTNSGRLITEIKGDQSIRFTAGDRIKDKQSQVQIGNSLNYTDRSTGNEYAKELGIYHV